MIIDNKFEIGDICYAKVDKDQSARIITGILIRPSGNFCYEVSTGNAVNWHYEFEITADRNILIATES